MDHTSNILLMHYTTIGVDLSRSIHLTSRFQCISPIHLSIYLINYLSVYPRRNCDRILLTVCSFRYTIDSDVRLPPSPSSSNTVLPFYLRIFKASIFYLNINLSFNQHVLSLVPSRFYAYICLSATFHF